MTCALRSPSSRSCAAPVSVIVSPGAKSVPFAETSSAGGAFTTSTIVAPARSPPASATAAVIVCVPECRVTSSVAPPPSGPSTLELQEIAAPRSPSSTSVAVACSRTTSPGTNAEPSLGATIRSWGGAFTTTTTCASAVFPPRSATEALIVCVPECRLATSSVPPVASGPSRLDVHAIAAVRSPSSTSVAVATSST